MPPRLFRLVGAGAVVVASVLSASCASSVPVHPVHGRVLLGGQPASGMVITLHPVGSPEGAEKWSVRGGVDSAGELVVRTYRMPAGDAPRMGAPAGEHVMTVSCPDMLEQFDAVVRDEINARYGEPERSSLRMTIKPGANDLGAIELLK
jgi:hypothetical protein